MKFSYAHHMPYTDIEEVGQDWPVPNKQFVPKRGAEMFETYLENKIYAEQAGFDSIGNNEHHMSPYGMMPNPNLVAAVIANRTKHALIQQTGVIVPLVNPIRLAEEYAMIDVMRKGRLVAGFMRGIPHEYVAYNVAPSESYSRMDEAITLIKKCWTEPEPFGWEGEHYQFRAVSIWPRPVQQPHPPILMSASSESSARLAAKHRAIAGLLGLNSMDEARKAIASYRGYAAEYGWIPSMDHFTVGMPCSIAPTYEEAKERLQSGMEYFFGVLGGSIRTAQKLVVQKTRYFLDEKTAKARSKTFVNARMGTAGMSFNERVEAGLVACGTPDMVISQFERLYKELGVIRVGLVIKWGNVPDWHVTRTMDGLRDIVFPAVKHLGEDAAAADAAE